jgi:hypothetical protein
MEATILDHSNQIIFKSDAKAHAGSVIPVKDMKQIQFRRGCLSMYVKTDHDSSSAYTEVDFLRRQVKRDLQKYASDPHANLCELNLGRETQPRGISEAKKQDLMKLCKSMPADKQLFFSQLQVNTTAQDLEITRDTDLY